ncbi:MAG: hypothetical protein NT118_01025 [Lentisphaerae bacterium]|nr:hypothetical protein [Lentisphaerota bacterium]
MKSKALLSILFSFSLFFLLQLNAGTISFKEKDGKETTLANVEIVSIKDGFIVIEKDKKRRDYPLNSISSFSPSDTSSSGGSIPGEFSDYKVLISDVKAPLKGVDKNGKSLSVEISYTVTRTNSAISRIKTPYVYLYVLVPEGNDSGEREILSFSHPSKAKPKGKGYDEAAILEVVNNFNRPTRDETERGRDFKTDFKNFGDETVTFELKSVKARKLLAYHVEIWGDTSIVAEKNWKDIDTKVGEKWWQRY